MAKSSSTAAPLPQIKPRDLHRYHQRLHAWYAQHGRHDLPWRTTDDPYHVWLSEVMLQQTQVATVLARFYHPFLKTFPTVQSLAAAPREKVMKAWEGLGYYRRAGFLHEAAKRAHNGLPRDVEGLRALPGIGKNTAHAIAAFAYHQPVAILEANVKRIVARMFAWERPSEKDLWAGAEALLNTKEPFHYNQAMMDLGNVVCTPRHAHCTVCPANSICLGKHAPEQYPAPKAKKAIPTRRYHILVLQDAAGRLHLEARGDALLGGLYGFPQVPITTDLRYPMREMQIQHWQALGEVVHAYSHFRLEGAVQFGVLPRRMSAPGWYGRDEIATLPLSGVDHKVLALVDKSHTAQKPAPKPRAKRMAH